MRKNALLQIRLTNSQNRKLEKLAVHSYKTKSELIREFIIEATAHIRKDFKRYENI